MVQALSILGPHGLVARDANSLFESKHATGVRLGTVQARTHVQLALACQPAVLKVQHRLRFTMHGQTENLGFECPDHAAALGALGHVSSDHLSTLRAHHSLHSASCFASCSNIGDALKKLRDIRTEIVSTSQHQNWS